MQVRKIEVDRHEARERWRDYRRHLYWSQPMDEEIARIYKQIAMGRTVIRAIESIRTAGLGADSRPKLAIARAHEREIRWISGHDVGLFRPDAWSQHQTRGREIRVPWPGVRPSMPDGKALVPMVPIHLRPKRALENYWILWEADWQAVPVDPMLLRRLGRGDAWLVLAAWDLTDVERAVLTQRLSS